jgi:dUTP pyrophosphatase
MSNETGEVTPKILFAKVKDSAIIPSKEEENAGFDIYACWDGVEKKDKIIKPHHTKLIPTGIACALPTNYYFQVEERGSTGSKGIKKSAGVVDSGYRGEIFIAISNVNDRYLVFGDKDNYLKEALNELQKWQSADVDNLTEQDKADMEKFLRDQYQDEYDKLTDEEKLMVIKSIYRDIKSPENNETLIKNISDAIFYPETKAIAQLVLHQVDNLPTEEINYDELKEIPSKRGTGSLGSSGK